MLGTPKVKKPDMPFTAQVASFARDQAVNKGTQSAIGSGKLSSKTPPSPITPDNIAAQRNGGRPSQVISRLGLLGGQ